MSEVDNLIKERDYLRTKRAELEHQIAIIDRRIEKLLAEIKPIKLTPAQRQLMKRIDNSTVIYWRLERGEQRTALNLSHKKLIHEGKQEHMNVTCLMLTELGKAALATYK